jgi:hypothetical protein
LYLLCLYNLPDRKLYKLSKLKNSTTQNKTKFNLLLENNKHLKKSHPKAQIIEKQEPRLPIIEKQDPPVPIIKKQDPPVPIIEKQEPRAPIIEKQEPQSKTKKKITIGSSSNKNPITKMENILYQIPNKMQIINYKLAKISDQIINRVACSEYKLNENKMSALNAYCVARKLFTYFFENSASNKHSTIDFSYFIGIYVQNEKLSLSSGPKYNFYIKLYNKHNLTTNFHTYNTYSILEYMCVFGSKIVKIKNTNSIIQIESQLEKYNLFIGQKENHIILSYGKCTEIDINNEQIDLFFKKSMDHIQIQKYYRYNRIKMIYWVSVFT